MWTRAETAVVTKAQELAKLELDQERELSAAREMSVALANDVS